MRSSGTAHRPDKGLDERVIAFLQGGALGLEEGADEKRMRGQRGGADVAGVVEPGEAQAGGFELRTVGGVEPVAAVIFAARRLAFEKAVQLRTGREGDGPGLLDERAEQLDDDKVGGGGVAFRVVGS